MVSNVSRNIDSLLLTVLFPRGIISHVFITAPNDKTLVMASKEKKENIRIGKQTATVYAAKIKTKIHNTSSFFKLSLKSNNKALALALVAQKQKSRELEAEVVRLRKDAQTTHFDLAHQRHKNKQLVSLTVKTSYMAVFIYCTLVQTLWTQKTRPVKVWKQFVAVYCTQGIVHPKRENSFINFSPLCCSKPITFVHVQNTNLFMFRTKLSDFEIVE
uniref:Uncharacterized protein n=1 Tax=Sinocyclocheilus rhinocerous TaxID=307959 RepID=A0A673HZE2_9TELE